MCYRCHICNKVHPQGAKTLRHTIYRVQPCVKTVKVNRGFSNNGNPIERFIAEPSHRREVERELLLCESCHTRLTQVGLTLPQLQNLLKMERRKRERTLTALKVPIKQNGSVRCGHGAT